MFLDTINKRLVDLQKETKPKEEPVQVISNDMELPPNVRVVAPKPFKSSFDVEAAKTKAQRMAHLRAAKAKSLATPPVEAITTERELEAITEDFRNHKLEPSVAAPAAQEPEPAEQVDVPTPAADKPKAEVKAAKPRKDKKPKKPKTKTTAAPERKDEKAAESAGRQEVREATKMIGVPTPVSLHADMRQVLEACKGLEGAPKSLKELAVMCMRDGLQRVGADLKAQQVKAQWLTKIVP